MTDTTDESIETNVDTLCVDLTMELLRLSECARAHEGLAKTDPEQYVAAVEDHFLQLIPFIADIKKAHNDALIAHRM